MTKSVWEWCRLPVSFSVVGQSSLLDETPWEGREFVAMELFLENLSFGRYREFKKILSLYLPPSSPYSSK